MIIDTTDTEKRLEFERQLLELKQQKLDKGGYDVDDICLVRIASHFPTDGFVPSISNVPFLVFLNDLSSTIVYDMLSEKEGNIPFARQMELLEESKSYRPLNTQYRSSVHFCLNGVVGNHEMGEFPGKIVIIDPLKNHENDENLLSVRGEDTYFKDGLNLSDEATVLVPIEMEGKFDDENVNVVYYNGDRDIACAMFLVSKGIVPEVIGKSYILDSDTSDFIRVFINEKGYEQEKHCYHPNYKEDDEKSTQLWDYYDRMFYNYLFEEAYHGEDKRREEKEVLLKDGAYDVFDPDNKRALRTVIEDIGLERYKEIVTNFNEKLREKQKSGELPTNNELLGIEPVITSDSSGYGGKK